MRLHVYGLALALLLWTGTTFAEGPQSLSFPGGNANISPSGSFTNLHAGPGAISVSGGNANGSDQINSVNVNGVITPTTFGARCDGTSDDYAPLNAALAACGASGGATAVEIPDLACATTGIISVPSNCTFRGRGPHSQLIELAGATFPAWPLTGSNQQQALIQNSNPTSGGNSRITIRDLTLVGAGNHNKAGNCIYFRSVTNTDIENVTCTNADLSGVLIDSSSDFKVRNSHWVAPQFFGIVIYNMTAVSQNFTITNNLVENSGGDSIFVALTPIPDTGSNTQPNASTDFSITGNLVKTAGDAGIEVGAAGNLNAQHTNFVVNNNEVDGSVNNGILLRNVAHFSVTGNTLKGNGTSAGATAQDEISVYAAEGNVNDGSIVGNHMWPTFGSGVGFAQGEDQQGNTGTTADLVISGNTVMFPTGTYTCTAGGRNGVGIAVNQYATDPSGKPAVRPAESITVNGNILSGVPCTGITIAGQSFAKPLVAGVAIGNTVIGQNQTSTTGISCSSANCTMLGNTLIGLQTGISTSYGNGVILGGTNFQGAITTGYTTTGSTFQPLDLNTSPLNLLKLGAVPPAAPGGAANCQLFVVTGTTAGTCKLQAVCGSGAAVTIVDNVGGC